MIFFYNNKNNIFKENYEKLKTQIEKNQLRDINTKLRKDCLGSSANKDSIIDTEKDQQIEELQKQIESYKEQLSLLQNNVNYKKNFNYKTLLYNITKIFTFIY
jgi:predicted RNase H-like nuclease (RuvC/YqgF family)